MMFSKQNTIILSFIVILSLVQLITSADPDPKVPADSAKTDAVSNDSANKPEPAKISQPTPVNIATTPTSTQQSSTTPIQKSIFCKMICMPFHACKTFFGDTFKTIWKSILKVRDNIISIYNPSITTVKKVVG